MFGAILGDPRIFQFFIFQETMLLVSALIGSVLLAALPFPVASDIVCDVPKSFTVDLSYDAKATISKIHLCLKTETNGVNFDTTPGLNSIQIRGDEVQVAFKGELEMHYWRNNVSTGPNEFSELFYERLIGGADGSILTPEGAETAWCAIDLLSPNRRRSMVHPFIANEIILLAKSCAQDALCSMIRSKYLKSETKTSGNETRKHKSPNQNSTQEECASLELQKTLNMMMDMGLARVIEKVKETSGTGGIDLPEMAQSFTLGSGYFKTTGHISLRNGTFRDITTLKRRSDAVVSHKGWKLTAACEVGLDRVEIEYKHFEVQYGLRAKGSVTGFVGGVALAIQVSANYDQKPCVATLDHIKVTRFGDIHINITGLGRSLEWLASTFSNWITSRWHKNIKVALETKIHALVQSKLSSFNCEKFRAWN
ncbi:uncharacterized protein [Venturia canescens]|uniref:uncharacterized protein n=1 Tax=Venturia canescens TaxID=32260 RepID=UPI001C9D53A7|nr:uncharacterized protein LOC122413170 [Venturia canescens]